MGVYEKGKKNGFRTTGKFQFKYGRELILKKVY